MFARTLCILATISLSVFSLDSQAQDAKPVVVSPITEAQIKSGQRVVGTVNPLKRSVIGSAVDGRVKAVPVERGDRVSQNDTLVQIRTETLKIELEAANAELELAKQRFAELENGSRKEDVDEAEANMYAADAAKKNAADNYERVLTLFRSNSASVAELGDAKEKADAAKFLAKASKAIYDRVEKGARIESVLQAKAQVELQTQRAKLISDRIEKCTIIAPFEGFVSADFTEVGAWIQQGDPVVELIQMSEVEVEAPVTAEVAVNLKKGLSVRVEFPELPNELLTGTIERIVPATASRARTFPVIIKLKNRIVDGVPLLLAGMLARVDFPAGSPKVLPLVPKDALVLNGRQRFVFVIDSTDGSPTARKVSVELGVAWKDRIQVEGDLKPGQQVVVVGNERLVPNSKVKIVKEIKSTEKADK